MKQISAGIHEILPSPEEDLEILSLAQKISKKNLDTERCTICLQKPFTTNSLKILVQCGHIMCHECVNKTIRNKCLKCIICDSILQNIEDADLLPSLGQNLLINSNFSKIKKHTPVDLCGIHKNKKKHYQCLYHNDILCRLCMENHKKTIRCKFIETAQTKKLPSVKF